MIVISVVATAVVVHNVSFDIDVFGSKPGWFECTVISVPQIVQDVMRPEHHEQDVQHNHDYETAKHFFVTLFERN